MTVNDLQIWAASTLLAWAEKQIASGQLTIEDTMRGRELVVDVRKAFDAPLPCHRTTDAARVAQNG